MNKALKILGIVVGALIVLIAAALIIVPMVVDPNDYKDEIAGAVHEQTGRDLNIMGDIELSLFPWIGVEMGKASLSNAQGFGDSPMAEFDNAEVKVRLMPLISRDVRVKAVNVSGLTVRLAKNKEGRSNWQDLVEARGETIEEEEKGGGGPGVSSLTVGGVNVRDAMLVWDDNSRNVNYQVSDLNLSTGPITPGEPADVEFETSIESSKPQAQGTISVAATVHLGDKMEKGSLNGLRVDLNITGEGVPGGRLDATLQGNAEVNFQGKSASITDLQLSAYGLSLNGQANVANFDTRPMAEVQLDLAEFNPKSVMRGLGLEPVKTKDENALTMVKGSLHARAGASSAELTNLDMTVDQTNLTGTAKINDYAKPDLAFDLSANSLDLGRYMPPAKEKQEETSEEEKKKKDKTAIPAEQKKKLRQVVLDGKLQVGEFKYWKMTFNDVLLNIKARNGVFRIDPLNMALYGGDYKSALTADFSGEVMKTALDLNLADMQLGSMLKDVMGSEKVTGLARLKLDISSEGERLWPFLRNLDGGGSAWLKDGAFKGFQVVPEPVQQQVNAQEKTPDIEKVSKEQKFKDITTDFNINDGVLKTKTMKLVAEGLGATGDGSVDLAEQTIDYDAVVDMTALPLIPFKISGPLADPSYSLDTSQFLKYAAEGIVKTPLRLGKGAVEGGADAVESIGEGVGETLKKGLGGLFDGGGDEKQE